MTAPRALVAGNWKMNGLKQAVYEITRLNELINVNGATCDVLICPPFTLIGHLNSLSAPNVAIGAQDCHMNMSGAHTGDISAEMLNELGCGYIIVGHSERRADHGESSETVNAKAVAAQNVGATAIICVGETIEQREAGEALDVVTTQLKASIPDSATTDNTIIAYEPVWAIGTGKTATISDIEHVHESLKERYPIKHLLYGGSVKVENAKEILEANEVDGLLIGTTSWDVEKFKEIFLGVAMLELMTKFCLVVLKSKRLLVFMIYLF